MLPLGEFDRLRQTPICVDARLTEAEGTGVSRYTAAVVAGLRAKGVEPIRLTDASHGRFGVADAGAAQARRWVAGRLHVRRALRYDPAGNLYRPDIYRLAHVHFGATGRVLRLHAPGPPGIMHWTYPIPAIIAGWVNLHTLHDAIPFTHPELSAVRGADMCARVTAIARVTDRIVTVSAHARAAILATTDLDPDCVVDCGGGIAGLDDAEAVSPARLVSGGYLVAVGLVEARKNLDRLAAAWVRAGRPLPLVVAGPDGADGPAIRVQLRRAGVTVLPFQSRAALAGLLTHARALAFPSLAEGFGLPIAEAMALGVPVITSRGAACEETAGGAALLVDPIDEGDIARALVAVSTDDALATALSERGRARAAEFVPDRFGTRLLALYDRLIA